MKKGGNKLLPPFFFVAIISSYLANFIFHLYMSRHLGLLDYGILTSLFSIFLIISIPVSTIQSMASRIVSIFKAAQREEEIKNFFIFFFKRLSAAALGITILLIALSPFLRNFLHLPSLWPLIILDLSLIFVLIWPIFLGMLQGLECFTILGINILAAAIVKLLTGIGLVSLGLGVNGAMMSLGISSLAGIFLAYFSKAGGNTYLSLRIRGFGSSSGPALEELRDSLRPLFPMLLTFFCFTVMSNIDVFLVRHFFQPELAGYYAAASLIGKIIFYLGSPIALVMFPRTTALYYQGKPGLAILKKSLGLAGLISGLLVSLYFIFPTFFILILPGEKYLPAASLVGFYGLAAAIFSLVNLFLFYHLSRNYFHFLWPLAIMTVLEILLISVFHSDLGQVLFIMIGSSLCLLFTNCFYHGPE